MSEAVERILSYYAGEPPGVVANLRRLLQHGKLGGTGKVVILPVDQGFEHGPARSFAPNPPAYDPEYHPQLALEAGCNAYAAPFGFIQDVAHKYAGRLPLILKVNNNDAIGGPEEPCPAMTSSVRDAARLGCSAVGFTIYPGSQARNEMYQQVRDLVREARDVGLPTVVWSYPRGGNLSKKGETAVDVVAYAAQLAAQLGAHVIKVKPPTDHIELGDAKKYYEGMEIDTLAKRVAHVLKSAFDGKRLLIFSGGAAKSTDDVLEEIKGLADGGAFGSIVGRNTFQRSQSDAVDLLHRIMDIYKQRT